MSVRRGEPVLAVDALRFACAALVCAFHLGTMAPLSPQSMVRVFVPDAALTAAGAGWTWFGWVGVELFFVISGYVIAMSMVGATPARFVRRRWLRLAPAAWVCATATAMVLMVAESAPAATILARWVSALLLAPTPTPIEPVYWTLSVEIMFYALVTAVLSRNNGGSGVERLACALGGASALFWGGMVLTGTRADTVIGAFWPSLTLLPDGVFFALGMLLSARRRPLVAAALVAIALCEVYWHAQTMAGVGGLGADPWIPVAVFAAGVSVLAGADRLQPALRRIGAARLGRLGRATYPLYLLHQTAAAVIVAAMLAIGSPTGAALLLAGVGAFAAALVVSEVLEPRLRAGLDAALRRCRGPARDSRPSASLPTG